MTESLSALSHDDVAGQRDLPSNGWKTITWEGGLEGSDRVERDDHPKVP